jgi:hypothetical protein
MQFIGGMQSSGMLSRVALVRMSDFRRAILRNIPEDGILHSHSHENLKSYKFIGFVPCTLLSVIPVVTISAERNSSGKSNNHTEQTAR